MISRREWLQAFTAFLVAGCTSTVAYAVAWEPRSLHLARYKVQAPKRRGIRPLRIAAVSDLHLGGPHVPLARLPEIVASLNELKPDITLLLGDFIASRDVRPDDPPMQAWAAILGELRAQSGVYAVLGNHDWWHDEAALARRYGPTRVGMALESVGITVLENRALKIDTGVAPLWIAGLGDQVAFDHVAPAGGIDDLPATLAQIPDDGVPILLLAHEPDIFVRVDPRVLLTVSGHTHGGQLRLLGWSPFVPSRYGNRYAYGHVVEDGKNLIVTSGIGTSRIPLRFGVPPEVMLIELGA